MRCWLEGLRAKLHDAAGTWTAASSATGPANVRRNAAKTSIAGGAAPTPSILDPGASNLLSFRLVRNFSSVRPPPIG